MGRWWGWYGCARGFWACVVGETRGRCLEHRITAHMVCGRDWGRSALSPSRIAIGENSSTWRGKVVRTGAGR